MLQEIKMAGLNSSSVLWILPL